MQQPTDDPAVKAAIARAYEVSQPYKAARPLTICHCALCLDDDTENLLLDAALHEIDRFELAAYASAIQADGSNIEVPNELRYFLPRFLELIAKGEEVHFADPCLAHHQLGLIDYRNLWPANEVKAIDGFFEAHLSRHLSQPIGWTTTHHGKPLAYSIVADQLCLASYGGGDIPACLKLWDRHPNPTAVQHLAVTVDGWLCVSDGKLTVSSQAFWTDRPEDSALVIDWLSRSQNADRLRDSLPPGASPELAALFASAETIVSPPSHG